MSPRASSDPRAADWQAAFGVRVRQLREDRGLSQMRLGEDAGFHFTYISQVEVGDRNVTLQTIHRLAEALGVEPSQLLKKT